MADLIRKAFAHHVRPVAIAAPGNNTAHARNLRLRNVPEPLFDQLFHLFASCDHGTAKVAAV